VLTANGEAISHGVEPDGGQPRCVRPPAGRRYTISRADDQHLLESPRARFIAEAR